MKDYSKYLRKPIFLSPNNFTPLRRTPWASHVIGKSYKSHLLTGVQEMLIGESWEFSCDPSFPSQLKDIPLSLEEFIKLYPNEVLSSQIYLEQKKKSYSPILVKLLSAAEPLSVQIHPKDEDSDLKAYECGKPESWLVLESEPGSGVYLGLEKEVSFDLLIKGVERGDDLSPYLHFVAVKKNDYFEIPPGVLHAVGPGVTLLEPQTIQQGKTGKTYRLWDWNRLYNEDGAYDLQQGKARELHLKECRRLLKSSQLYGEDLLRNLQKKPKIKKINAGITLVTYPANEYYQCLLFQIQQNFSLSYKLSKGYAIAFLAAGKLEQVSDEKNKTDWFHGQTSLWSHLLDPLSLRAKKNSELIFILPKGAELLCSA